MRTTVYNINLFLYLFFNVLNTENIIFLMDMSDVYRYIKLDIFIRPIN